MAEIMQNSNIVPDILRTSSYNAKRSNNIEYTVVLSSLPYRDKYYSGFSYPVVRDYSYLYQSEAIMSEPTYDPDTTIVKESARKILTDDVLLNALLKELPDSLKRRAENFGLKFYLRNDGLILTLSIKPKFRDGAGLCYSKEALLRIVSNLNQYKQQLAWETTDIALEASRMAFLVEATEKKIEEIAGEESPEFSKDSTYLYHCHVNQEYYYNVRLDSFNAAVKMYPRDSISAKAKQITEQNFNEQVIWNKFAETVPPSAMNMLDGFALETIVRSDGSVVLAHIETHQINYEENNSDEYRWKNFYGPSSFISLDCFPKQLPLQEFIVWMNEKKIFTPWEGKTDENVDYLYISHDIHPNSYYIKRENMRKRREERASKASLKQHVDDEVYDSIFYTTNITTDTAGTYTIKIDTISGYNRFLRCEIIKKSIADKISPLDNRGEIAMFPMDIIEYNGNKLAKYNMDLNGIFDVLVKDIPDSLKQYISVYNFYYTSTKELEIVSVQFDLFFHDGTLNKIPILYDVSDCYHIIQDLNEMDVVKPWKGKRDLVVVQAYIRNDRRLNELKRKFDKREFDRTCSNRF